MSLLVSNQFQLYLSFRTLLTNVPLNYINGAIGERGLNMEALHQFLISCNSTIVRSDSKCGAILRLHVFSFFHFRF